MTSISTAPARPRRGRTAFASLSASAAAIVLALLVAAPTTAAPTGALDATKLWATINVCDTASRPDTIGLRASMPGSGNAADELFMRFQVQYFSPKDGLWYSLAYGGDSGFVDVGSGRQKAREAGRFFVLAPIAPARGQADRTGFQLRGLVSFEWRRDGVVYRSLRRRTTPKHVSSAGADPPGFSAALCVVS